MMESSQLASECPSTTDGDIAFMNLESARRRAWSRFWHDPARPGVAELVVEQEHMTLQFKGDPAALDRLETLARHVACADTMPSRAALIQAQVASMAHRFADARCYLAEASRLGAPHEDTCRLLLNIDQACGTDLDRVLEERREIAGKSGRLEDLLPLGALLGDLHEFSDVDHVYRQALQGYRDVSPFPVAWACFQLGMLWGELVPQPQPYRAAQWYQRAIGCLPGYTKARIHLAEIYSSSGRTSDAEALLLPALESGDPEAVWRLADVLILQGRQADAEAHLHAARVAFEALLERHLLAFADHGAEFYAGSGSNSRRALELARFNVANRPTVRAYEQAHDIAFNSGNREAASEVLAEARIRWGKAAAFASSPLDKRFSGERGGAAA